MRKGNHPKQNDARPKSLMRGLSFRREVRNLTVGASVTLGSLCDRSAYERCFACAQDDRLGRSLVRINEANAALVAIDQVDHHVILAAARWRKSSGRFLAF